MDESPVGGRLAQAQQQFRSARLRADLERLWARMSGRTDELIPFDEVRERLGAHRPTRRIRERVPLTSIVGSVGRYADFTRSFLPRRDSDENRWTAVRLASSGFKSLPPVELYRLGDVYFVLDGNHRVSVARQMGYTDIDAYVTEIESRVALQPHDSPDDIIIKAEYAEFLAYTEFDTLFPDIDLRVTVPGQYRILMEMIDIEHYYLSRDAGEKVAYSDAVRHWYSQVYRPVLALIRESSLLEHFPGRSETDLYAWIARNRIDLSRRLGWDVEPRAVVRDLVKERPLGPLSRISRVGGRLVGSLLPAALEAAPPAGSWRTEWLPTHRIPSLFQDILVAVGSVEAGWRALEQALQIARYQNSRIHGIHVIFDPTERGSEAVQRLRDAFIQRSSELQISSDFQIYLSDKQDSVGVALAERSRWADLVTIPISPLSMEPGDPSLSSPLFQILRRSARPVLTVPGQASELSNPLLAYDGSPEAREALYVACNLTGRIWDRLTIVSVIDGPWMSEEVLGQALEYAQRRGVAARTIRAQGEVTRAIQETASDVEADLILMGGSSRMAWIDRIFSSPVEKVLRSSTLPTLICR